MAPACHRRDSRQSSLKTEKSPHLSTELVERVSKGIKQELMPIVAIEGVGRVRGRIIFNSGFQTVEDLKQASIEELTALPSVGPRLAKKIKEQVGGYVKKENGTASLPPQKRLRKPNKKGYLTSKRPVRTVQLALRLCPNSFWGLTPHQFLSR